MRKILLVLLVLLFISGYAFDLRFSFRTTIPNYFYLISSMGLIVVYTLSNKVAFKILKWIQLGFIGLTIVGIVFLYILTVSYSLDSVGFVILIALVLTLLASQLVIFVGSVIMERVRQTENKVHYENIIILCFTGVFFILHQVVVPNNWDVPVTTWIVSYLGVFLFFWGFVFIITKVLNRDLIIPLFVGLICLTLVQFLPISFNVFLRLPLQICVFILMVAYFQILKELKINQSIEM